jgi:hypothetical protein
VIGDVFVCLGLLLREEVDRVAAPDQQPLLAAHADCMCALIACPVAGVRIEQELLYCRSYTSSSSSSTSAAGAAAREACIE